MVFRRRRNWHLEQTPRNEHIRNWKCSSCSVLTAASFVVNIVLISLFIILRQPGCHCDYTAHCDPSCPYDWIGYKGKCYFFSKDERNWSSSQNFCVSHNASLAKIENEEKDFVMRYRGKDSFWIGLSRNPGHPWKWTDGENATIEVMGEGDNCAYLNDEAKASCSRCNIEHLWICIKSVKRLLQQNVSSSRP
ncbi:C-type lectin domain family 2 member B-like [Tiliqua scincoides]|uniref:C-type lectin domain family 2 member B-like n=1 Tax=Tiliqua scincoides TaxID=71010 RepID=UPI00346288C0